MTFDDKHALYCHLSTTEVGKWRWYLETFVRVNIMNSAWFCCHMYWDCSAQSFRWHTPLYQLKKIMSFCFRAPVWTRLIKSWINTRLERLTEERRYMYWIHVFCVSSPLYLKNKRLWLIAIIRKLTGVKSTRCSSKQFIDRSTLSTNYT